MRLFTLLNRKLWIPKPRRKHDAEQAYTDSAEPEKEASAPEPDEAVEEPQPKKGGSFFDQI